MVAIAVIPSNQHLNGYEGIPGTTEEMFAVRVCAWVVQTLKEYGADVGYFHVPGKGEKSTDELNQMLEQAIAWKPDYMLSVHSDAVGDKAKTGVLMLMPLESLRYEGRTLGQMIAEVVGLPYKGSWVYGQEARKINYLKALRDYKIPGCLVEVGEHATALEAKWNWEHTREIGVGIGNALAEYLGLEGDEMSQEQFDRLMTSLQAQSYRSSITNARSIGDDEKAAKLNAEFYKRWPEGETGLPKDWAPPK